MNMNTNMNGNNSNSDSDSIFKQSLDELTCDDLAPKTKKKTEKRVIAEKIIWAAVTLSLFAVFVVSGSTALRNTVDFLIAQTRLSDLADSFSPTTGVSETSLALKPGSLMYALADCLDLLNGTVVYPDDNIHPTPPPVNPGTDPTPSSDTPKEEDPYLSEERLELFRTKLDDLQTQYKNGDIFAWIFIPGTNIDYPVVIGHTDEPDYYLDRGVDKKYNVAGSIYMDFRNEKNLLNNRFTVIYGHNIRQRGTMFNRLVEFKSAKMFEKYRYIYIFTKEAALKYEIFSVYEAHAYESPSISITGFTDQSFLKKITDIQQKSINVRQGLTLSARDHVLMLYTCANTPSVLTNNDIRCMVFGVLVDAAV